MAKAGYDPAAFARLLANLEKNVEILTGESETKGIFNTHPITEDRVAQLEKRNAKRDAVTPMDDGTALLPQLNGLIYGHMLVAIGATLVWVPLVILSLRRFPNPPRSTEFGSTHRRWGRLGMTLMILSGTSAVPLYYVGFAA